MVNTNCGAWLPSLDEKDTESVLVATNTKLYIPSPVISGVTLYSTQTPVPIVPLSSIPLVVRTGRVFQVIPASVQSLVVAYTAGPSTVEDVE